MLTISVVIRMEISIKVRALVLHGDIPSLAIKGRNIVILITLPLVCADHLHLLLTTALLELSLKSRVVVVLDMVVGAARQVLGDLAPTVAVDGVQLEDLDVLLGSPLNLFDSRVKMIVPPEEKIKPYVIELVRQLKKVCDPEIKNNMGRNSPKIVKLMD